MGLGLRAQSLYSGQWATTKGPMALMQDNGINEWPGWASLTMPMEGRGRSGSEMPDPPLILGAGSPFGGRLSIYMSENGPFNPFSSQNQSSHSQLFLCVTHKCPGIPIWDEPASIFVTHGEFLGRKSAKLTKTPHFFNFSARIWPALPHPRLNGSGQGSRGMHQVSPLSIRPVRHLTLSPTSLESFSGVFSNFSAISSYFPHIERKSPQSGPTRLGQSDPLTRGTEGDAVKRPPSCLYPSH